MKTETFILAFFSFLVVITSCQQQSGNVEPILQRAETLVEQHPDSVLVLLEEIQNPQSLKKSLYYRYYLLYMQAKDKSYLDITSDTLIFNIQKYYDNRNYAEKTALASFYCGRIKQEQKKYEEALETYLNAEKYLIRINNDNLKGLFQGSIGEIYYQQLLKDEAIRHLKLAEKYFHQAKNYKNEIIVSNFIGNSLLMQGKTDSAFIYYNKALALADKNKLRQQQAGIREGLGVAYREIKDLDSAEKFFREAWRFSEDSLKKARLSFNIAHLYEQKAQNDSAIYYLNRCLTYLSEEKENYLSANIFKTWSSIEENEQHFQEALDKYKLYSKYLASILDENKNRAVLEIEGKYNFQLVENKNKQLLIERQRIFFGFLIILLILFTLIFFFYKRSVQNATKLKEAMDKIAQMKKMSRKYNEKENSFRNILIQHFDILKKAALLEGYLKENEKNMGKHLIQKFNEVVYGEKNLDWNLLYQKFNNLGDNFFDRLRKKFPQLLESEFRICCLTYIEFNNTEIGLILNYGVNTVQVKKSSIRKKLGINAFGDIRNFLNTAINNQ